MSVQDRRSTADETLFHVRNEKSEMRPSIMSQKKSDEYWREWEGCLKGLSPSIL